MWLWLEYSFSAWLVGRRYPWRSLEASFVERVFEYLEWSALLARHDRESRRFEHVALRAWRAIKRWEEAGRYSNERLYSGHTDQDVNRKYALHEYESLLKRIALAKAHEADLRRFAHTPRGKGQLTAIRERFVSLEAEEYLRSLEASDLGLPVHELKLKHRPGRM